MPRSSERETRILDAAQALLLKQGWRATSMEAIAARAEIAKPTLYAYFPHKDAVLSALAERIEQSWGTDFATALAQGGDAVEQISGALTGRQKVLHRLRAASPHMGDVLGRAEMAALEAGSASAIEQHLGRDGRGQSRFLAQILVAASHGIGERAQSPAEIGPAIRLLVERLVRQQREGG